MEALVLVAWSAMAFAGSLIISAAVFLWLRDVLRSKDGETDGRMGEPSPVDERAVPWMALTAAVTFGVVYLRQVPASFGTVVFPAVFAGFALSAGWYLMARRSPEEGRARVQLGSGAIAAGFGALSGLASS